MELVYGAGCVVELGVGVWCVMELVEYETWSMVELVVSLGWRWAEAPPSAWASVRPPQKGSLQCGIDSMVWYRW